MEHVPETFNWVKARAECSVDGLFKQLVETVDSDVKAAQAVGIQDIAFSRPSESKVMVVLLEGKGGITMVGVVFERTSAGLTVKAAERNGSVLFEAVPNLDPDGRCWYEVDGQPLELWQVSRKALGRVFWR